MKHAYKIFSLSVLVLALIISGLPMNNVKAENPLKDLIIYQNAPQVEVANAGEEIGLKALNVYKDGHFTLVSEGLDWSSSNRKVASVDKDGNVTLTGKNGKTFIKLTNGEFSDRIAVQVKPAPKKGEKGKPASEAKIVKQKGERYNLVDEAIANMTIEEKIGQMLMPDFRNWDGENVTEMLPEIEQLVKDYHLGGVILFRENVVTTEQTT
ncbi:beta-N-acetylhexosaminidase, partial [Bacillus haikouensis]